MPVGLVRGKSFANFVLAAGGALTLYVLFHFLRTSPATGQLEFASPMAWVAQCTGLACLSALLFGSLLLPAGQKIVVAGVFFSLAAGLYAAEIVVASSGLRESTRPYWSIDRASGKTRMQMAALARGYGVTIDHRDQVEMLTELRKQRVDAVPGVMLGEVLKDRHPVSGKATTDTELLPLGGLANTFTVLCNQSGRYVSYESDEHGFRNPRGIWNSARANMAAVGASHAQGYCVPDGATFVDLLRDDYPITLNLGMSGQSALLKLGAIKEYLPPYAPKSVLWVFSEGIDLQDMYLESRHPLLMRYLESAFTQELSTRQPEIDRTLRRFVAATEMRARESRVTVERVPMLEKSLGLVKLWSLRETVSSLYGTDIDDERGLSMVASTERNLLTDALQQAQTVARGWGGNLYFVYLPSWKRYNSGPQIVELERTKVLTLVSALGIPIIDLHPVFDAHSDPLSLFPFRRFGHYNEEGHKIVAEAVRETLSSQDLIHDDVIAASGSGGAP